MGKLLKFTGRKKSADTAAAVPRGGAEILIFTGVRYERGTPPPTHVDSKRRKRKRV